MATRETVVADNRAQEKGVLLLGECGLDPGIDSMCDNHLPSR